MYTAYRGSSFVLGAALALGAAAASVSAGCSTPDMMDARVLVTAPERSTFVSVSPALIRTCGSIECHGSRLRNMRMFGYTTGRLAVPDTPLSPGTTPAEVEENYRGVVGLEPEVMSAVTRDKGANPTRLSLFRKGRGLDSHKGGVAMRAGDNLDKCLISWFAGAIDTDSCDKATSPP